MTSIRDLKVEERPRERLVLAGAEILTDSELLAVIIGSGNRKAGVVELAERVKASFDSCSSMPSIAELSRIDGIGRSKASMLIAAIEFARRRIRPYGTKICGAGDAFNLLRHMGDRKQEIFLTITLNGAHEVIASRIITIGLLNRTQVHPREVFADAITDRAAAVILAHNHPSGDLSPSNDDLDVTKRLVEVGKLLGIAVLDHLVFSSRGYHSLREQGLI